MDTVARRSALELSMKDGNGRRALKRPVLLGARRLAAPLTVETLEGPVAAEAGDFLLRDDDGHEWPVSAAHFESHYESLPDGACGTWSRVRAREVTVRALQLESAMSISVGRSGSRLHGRTGDWLVYYGGDRFGIVAKSLFPALYDLQGA